ncbi:MAG: DUF2497 domain-containing protein [Alphaproteobacteria bacterium]|nr:DUF2497 domain-containing protein [Alphaproteobacteria bacterium]
MTAPTPPAPSGTEIDDIMSSIRESVATESTKVGQGNDDLLNAAANEDDVLELTPAELTSPAAAPTALPPGNAADILGVPTLSPADEAADEFDKLLAEIGQEKQQRAAEIQAQKAALLADVEPLGAEPLAAPAVPESSPTLPEAADTDAALGSPATEPTALPPMAAPVAAQPVVAPPVATHKVGMLPGSDGLQLVLPTEVLAAALRPMVQGWLDANLPKVVEQLVQAEIAKLNQ